MSETFTIDQAGLDRQIQRTIELTNKRPREIVEQASRIAVDACWRLTPPTATKHPMSESTKDSRVAGMNAVANDVGKCFSFPGDRGIEMIDKAKDGVEPTATRFWKLANEGKFSEARAFLRALGIEVDSIAVDASYDHHQRQRDARGRVRKRPPRQLVLDKAKIGTYLKRTQARVGMARGGWIKPVVGLRARSFPAWASAHAGPGMFTVTGPGDAPSIIIGNLVPYIQRAGSDLRVMQSAFDITRSKMEAQIKVLLAKMAGTFQRAT